MQKLNMLMQLASAASSMKDITQNKRTYHFAVGQPTTFYLRAENATVEIRRWRRPVIEVTVKLQGAFGWRIATDQDEAGVYVAAVRRNVVGGFSSAIFEVMLPLDTYLMLNLEDGRVLFDNFSGTLELPGAQPSE